MSEIYIIRIRNVMLTLSKNMLHKRFHIQGVPPRGVGLCVGSLRKPQQELRFALKKGKFSAFFDSVNVHSPSRKYTITN
jgi:hypothetical protein